jgi:DNA-binding LytR/AlgR family response regulator
MSTRRFLLFNIGFWLLAAAALLIDNWPNAQRHWDVAILRYLYFLVIVLLVTSALTRLYDSGWFRQRKQRLPWLLACSAAAALLTALIINPLTYLMIGADIHAVPYEILSTGTLYFVLLYLIWSVLFFQFRSMPVPAGDSDVGVTFRVEKQGEQRQLRDRDICYVSANGDYVELVTAGNSYLQKESLSHLAERLDKQRFRRVHRSAIINLDKVESVTPRPGGAFAITLDGGHTVQSSRSYKAVVEDILPPG